MKGSTRKKTAGIVRTRWSEMEKGYLTPALEYYDEALYINPMEVTYRFERETGITIVEYNGKILNDLSMLYTLGYSQATFFLAKTLTALGCPISDHPRILHRECIGKLSSVVDFFHTQAGTTTHAFSSYQRARAYLLSLDPSCYPLLNKPLLGNQGKGIVSLKNTKEALTLARQFFQGTSKEKLLNRSSKQRYLVFEKQMVYVREWRIYVVDGELIDAYEKQKAEGKIAANLHQGGRPVEVEPALKSELFDFCRKHLPDGYQQGVYGIDLAVTDEGTYHFVEINRTPGSRGLLIAAGKNFPLMVHERLSKRARPIEMPTLSSHVITFLGDTNPGETYQLLNEKHGRENILKTRGYEYGYQNFISLLESSDFTIANLEVAITSLRDSPLREAKPYIDWTDPQKTPELLKKMRIDAVSLGNNHTMDFGGDALEESIHALKNVGITAFGAGANQAEASKVLHHHVKLGEDKLHIIIAAGFEHRKSHEAFGYYASDEKHGVNSWARAKARRQMRYLRQKFPQAFIIAFPHWGINYEHKVERQELIATYLIDGGADLVIGHGSHMLLEMEKYKEKWIIYGIGNFVFNSPGQYQKTGKKGYGMIARLILQHNKEFWMRLYPIVINNKVTDYQSRYVDKTEFDEVVSFIMPCKKEESRMERHLSIGRDEYGYYLSGAISRSYSSE